MLAVVSQLAVVTNALLIAITSNFVGFEVYTRGGYRDEYRGRSKSLVPDESNNFQGLSGYANWSSTPFRLADLVDGSAFPSYSAQSLEIFNPDGSEIENVFLAQERYTGSSPPLYLPFVDFDCLDVNATLNNCTSYTTVTVEVAMSYNEPVKNVTTFTEDQYERFYEEINCRELVLDARSAISPETDHIGTCFNGTQVCR